MSSKSAFDANSNTTPASAVESGMLAPGTMVAGKYRIQHHLGGGGMGAVYKARQVALDKEVALKVMHAELSSDATFAARFNREARAASRLAHPNSIAVMDFGAETDGRLYLVMEFVDGKDLEAMLVANGALPVARIVSILSQVLAALSVAHDLGIVHRDLKPENILILDGFDDEGHDIDVVKVCDFGIASMANEGRISSTTTPPDSGMEFESAFRHLTGPPSSQISPKVINAPKLTQVGAIMGTPAYMSPEQCLGELTDARSDIYALGVILYQCLTGRLPFETTDVAVMMNHHILTAPVAPINLMPAVDSLLSALCMRALAKEPELRFASARQFRSELRRALITAGRNTLAPPPSGESGMVRPGSPPVPGFLTDTPLERATRESTARGVTTAADARMPRENVRSTGDKRSRVMVMGAVFGLVVLTSSAVMVAKRMHASNANVENRGAGQIATLTNRTGDLPSAASTSQLPSSARSQGITSEPSGPQAPGPRSANSGSFGIPLAPIGTQVRKDLAHSEDAPVASVETPLAVATVSAPPVVAETATPVAVTAAPVASAPAAPIAYEKAHVRLSVGATDGLKRSEVQAFVARIGVDTCYQTSLRTLGRSEGGSGTAHLVVDENGVVQSAAVTLPGYLQSARNCIAGQFQGQRLPHGPDTGDGSVDVLLAFIAP